MKFSTKLVQHNPPHLRHVTTLPWEIRSSFVADMEENGQDFDKKKVCI